VLNFRKSPTPVEPPGQTLIALTPRPRYKPFAQPEPPGRVFVANHERFQVHRNSVGSRTSYRLVLRALECGIPASPALCVIGRSHRAGDTTYNNGRLRRRSTARLEQSAGRDPSQPISGCLQTFIKTSLLYSVFLLTLSLITF